MEKHVLLKKRQIMANERLFMTNVYEMQGSVVCTMKIGLQIIGKASKLTALWYVEKYLLEEKNWPPGI